MTNLTLAIDESVLRQARLRAVQEDTSVNAQIRDFLVAYSRGIEAEQRQAMSRFVTLAEKTKAGGGLENRSWTRDNLHER